MTVIGYTLELHLLLINYTSEERLVSLLSDHTTVVNKETVLDHPTSDKELERLSDIVLSNQKKTVLSEQFNGPLKKEPHLRTENHSPKEELLTWIELHHKSTRKRERRLRRNECVFNISYLDYLQQTNSSKYLPFFISLFLLIVICYVLLL